MKPPAIIPAHLYDRFTMRKRINVRYQYRDDSAYEDKSRVYTNQMIDGYLEKIRQGKTFYYGDTDSHLYRALKKYDIKGKQVAIIGSQCPLYESFCLFFGGIPVTIEYQKIISTDKRLATMTVDEYQANPHVFDAAFAISSFEHDGLGRYGDSINPDGDIKAMASMKSVIKKNGLLFLSVPIGADEIVFNLHRIYGKLRLPVLLEGWNILAIYSGARSLQPVFVLENFPCSKKSNLLLFFFLCYRRSISCAKKLKSKAKQLFQ